MNDHQIIGEIFTSDKVLANYLSKNQKINAGSLGRVYQHIQKNKVPSWGILTSYRDNNSPSKNKELFKQLKSKVRALNLGFFIMKGHGQEEDDEGKVHIVIEPSLFIPNISLKNINSLSDLYNQLGFIYSGPETKNKIMLISKQGSEKLGSFHPMKIAHFYSKIKGKPFVFASCEAKLWDKPSSSNMERLWRHRQGFNNDEMSAYIPKK